MEKNTGLKTIDECKDFFDENLIFSSILKLLFENTFYITRVQILNDLKNNIEKWIIEREDRPLYVVLNSNKIGSEHYFYYTLKYLLPEHKLIISINNNKTDILDGGEILYLDDWSLTGVHMESIYESIFYRSRRLNIQRFPGRKFHFTCITSIMSDRSINIFKPLYTYEDMESDLYFDEDMESDLYYTNTTFKCYYTHKVKPFVDILSEHIGHNVEDMHDINFQFFQRFCDKNTLDKNIELLPIDNHEYFINLSSPTFEPYPVHSDYKIANVFGSFPNIYRYCRVTVPSKDFMEDTITFFHNLKY